MELVESPRIHRCAFIPDSFPKLGEIDEISSDAAFIAEDSGEESDDRKRTDDFVGEGGEGVWFLYVSFDCRGETASVAFGRRRGRGRSRGGGGDAEAEMEEGRGDLMEGSGDVGDNHHD